jgi:cell division protein FtsW
MSKNYIDIWLFGAFFILILIGIIMVYSASAYYAEEYFNNHFYFIKRHILWVLLGLVAMAIAYNFPYKRLVGYSIILLFLSLGLLIYAAINHNRWIIVGPFHFQAVDVAKFSLIFFLADSLSRKEVKLKSFSEGFFPHFFYIALFTALVVLQPDFSSASMLLLIGFIILFASPVKIRHLLVTGAAALPLMGITILLFPYMWDRILSYIGVEDDPLGKGYQVFQSLVSLGTGGFLGVGYAESKQKMFYLPEAHTDFIFSIIGEEWGLIGSLFLTSLFIIIMFRGLKIAARSIDRFSFYLTVGITANFVLYALVHMMVTLGVAPPTGLPMPFISYGGTSILFSCIYAGLLLNIANNTLSDSAIKRHRFSQRAVANLHSRKLKYLK